MSNPCEDFEFALIAQRVASRVAEVVGNWNTKGKWYRQDFSDIQQYFQASGEYLKNGNSAGVIVTKNSPRSKPRAKKISVSKHERNGWKAIDEKDVPDDIKDAAASK